MFWNSHQPFMKRTASLTSTNPPDLKPSAQFHLLYSLKSIYTCLKLSRLHTVFHPFLCDNILKRLKILNLKRGLIKLSILKSGSAFGA